MSKPILKLPINKLSFGNVSYGILYSLFKKGVKDLYYVNIGDVDLTSFNHVRDNEEFKSWLQGLNHNYLKEYSKNSTSFMLWHIIGSELSMTNKNVLFTFHELDALTGEEKNILNNMDHIFVSSTYSKNVFEENGVTTPITVVPLGFDDTHFKILPRFEERVKKCQWQIMGKFEHRKRTEKTIRAWLKKYANSYDHVLNISIYNSFFSPEDNNKILHNILEGREKPFNLNILPFFDTVDEVNKVINNADIFIDMSGGEAFSLPSFTAACLGKHVVVHNNTGISEWANSENAFLVEPTGKISAVDNIFFRPNDIKNVGNIFDYDEQDFLDQCDNAYKAWLRNPINEKGKLLPQKFNWDITTDKILEVIQK